METDMSRASVLKCTLNLLEGISFTLVIALQLMLTPVPKYFYPIFTVSITRKDDLRVRRC